MTYVLLFASVFALNLLPAFGPPTWIVLVLAKLNWHLNVVALVVLGVLGAASGRYVLAWGSQHLGRFIPARYRENLAAAQARLTHRRSGLAVLFGLFVVSPLPSAQLFVAAGLLRFPLLPLSAAFAIGRLVTYSLYLSLATVADQHFGSLLHHVWGAWWSIVLQLVLLLALALTPLYPWKRSSTR